MKTISKSLSTITFAALLSMTGAVWASADHDHDSRHKMGGMMNHESHGDSHGDHGSKHGDHGSGMDMGNMFLKKKNIDGYEVSFHVMKAKAGHEMGGSHHFMVKVEKDGKAINNLVMNTKVKHPNDKSETKKAMKMGDWMMAAYDLDHPGKHQLMILFKTADGKTHKGGVYYP